MPGFILLFNFNAPTEMFVGVRGGERGRGWLGMAKSLASIHRHCAFKNFYDLICRSGQVGMLHAIMRTLAFFPFYIFFLNDFLRGMACARHNLHMLRFRVLIIFSRVLDKVKELCCVQE